MSNERSVKMGDREISFTLSPEHTQMDRALLLARLALCEFANDRHGMTERAAFRIADALEKYQILDARARMENMPTTNPLSSTPITEGEK